tara:strand:- start:78985 stop:79593 length:609 start_codon:yes stop_codon:yes gene_type:complete
MLLIGIYGGTGSGKTTIVKEIISEFNNSDINVISQDSYYKDNSDISFKKRSLINFDHPSSVDFELLYNNLKKLKNGCAINSPTYDYKLHKRKKHKIKLKPKKIIILEGILIMADQKLRSIIDLKIFIEANDAVRKTRRLKRDIVERGRTQNQIENRYEKYIQPMHKKFIQPTKKFADIIIENQEDKKVDLSIIINKIKLFVK